MLRGEKSHLLDTQSSSRERGEPEEEEQDGGGIQGSLFSSKIKFFLKPNNWDLGFFLGLKMQFWRA